jgi:outer membrane receptor protein involved in Fe transport
VTILDNGAKHAWAVGFYAQDEWKLSSSLTLNYGLRYDQYRAFNAENQLSPRVNLVWKPDDATAVHLGYARYFSPPPYENVASTDITLFDNTTAAGDHTDTTPKAERADYYDTGLTRKITDQISLGLDSYFKADSNLLDEGQFGAPIILTPFNYQTGRQYGGEFTANYNAGDLNAYLNASYERAAGRTITSSQFEFSSDDLAYIADHYIPLDHQQIVSLSGGVSYKWQGTIFSSDFIYGSGLRKDGATPNGEAVPGYVTVNLGVSHSFDFWGGLTARFDVINIADEVYEIRDGTGVGVGAPQFGARRGFFVGLSKAL